MGTSAIDWFEIERDFRETGLSYPKLAAKYGVSLSTLKKKAAKNKWALQKALTAKEREPAPKEEPEPVIPEEPTAIVYQTETERRRELFLRMTDDMANRIQDALAVVDVSNVFAIKMLASALKDLRDLQGIRDPLDEEEKRARIAKLRSDTRIVDSEEGGGIIFMPSMEDRPTPPEDSTDE